jgi:putative holliday junction resolvase
MPRILAIDYGTKRAGIAVTDPEQIIATALDTIHPKDLIKFLKEYTAREKVECFVIGEPKQMDYTPSEITGHINHFIKVLKKEFPDIPVKRADERFTSLIASRSMIENNMKKSDRRNKELVDQISAVLILQSYMERKK